MPKVLSRCPLVLWCIPLGVICTLLAAWFVVDIIKWSGAGYRGLPISCFHLPPYGVSPRRWELNIATFMIDTAFWTLVVWPFAAMIRWISSVIGNPRKETTTGLCIKCGYDLRGLREQRCPECGTPFADKSGTNKGDIRAPEQPNQTKQRGRDLF